ncbi:MAG: nitrite/sulfite reductase [Candidatus Omnitrophota bacterium]
MALNEKELPSLVREEIADYESWIRKYRAGEAGEVKMQKIRLQLGTYAQRQEGVQMQRIKFPGGMITADQLEALAAIAEKYAGGFIHVTTRQDAQLYYLKLEECPDMLRALARAGITTREACGNTVRNITASYRSGTAPGEPFDVRPYCQALYRFLIRNKYNQVMGRKFKIAFEGTSRDHAGIRFHDLGFQARLEGARRGFRVFIGGGLGATPSLGYLYADFLPEEELLNLTVATIRVFDRWGERKNRMAARMKFLVKKMGWEKFRAAVDEERKKMKLSPQANDYLRGARETPVPSLPDAAQRKACSEPADPGYRAWKRDSVLDHKVPGFAGVHVRLKLGDILSDKARALAQLAREYSAGELRISMEQNFFLPWVPANVLPEVYDRLKALGLAEIGAETLEDVTTCPGADTCRLGITSAKGLGAGISAMIAQAPAPLRELARSVRVKISGCPNGCAQHGIAPIGFQGAAMKKDEKTVPAHELFLGGQIDFEQTAFGERIGKFPAKNGPRIVETLLGLYQSERKNGESFNACLARIGKETIREKLAPLAEVPAFEKGPEYYQDWGHENEKFAVRMGIKGECAGATVQEKSPTLEAARERLSQAQALQARREFAEAGAEAYEAIVLTVRVPLYANLVDPFTAEQALWEFENIFARAGRIPDRWIGFSEAVEQIKNEKAGEASAHRMIGLAEDCWGLCEKLFQELAQPSGGKGCSI